MKKGRFSKEEQKFIKENHESLSIEQIATELERDPDSVESYVNSKLGKTAIDKREIEAYYDLKSRPYWRELEGQFTERDVLPTEELQVLDAIKLEVLMNRALKDQQTNLKDINRYEDLVTDEKRKPLEVQDKDYIYSLERQVAVLRAASETMNRDYKDLQTKKSSMLKDLKATREQRVKRLEDSKQTFIGWVRNLISDPQTRHEMGMEMEKMRLAAYKEQERLSEYHQYEDKIVDQPFLTPDTVKDD